MLIQLILLILLYEETVRDNIRELSSKARVLFITQTKRKTGKRLGTAYSQL